MVWPEYKGNNLFIAHSLQLSPKRDCIWKKQSLYLAYIETRSCLIFSDNSSEHISWIKLIIAGFLMILQCFVTSAINQHVLFYYFTLYSYAVHAVHMLWGKRETGYSAICTNLSVYHWDISNIIMCSVHDRPGVVSNRLPWCQINVLCTLHRPATQVSDSFYLYFWFLWLSLAVFLWLGSDLTLSFVVLSP